jgi:hypothetical protein
MIGNPFPLTATGVPGNEPTNTGTAAGTIAGLTECTA